MDSPQKSKQTRCRYVVMGVVFIAVVIGVGLAIGLVYGLKSKDDKENSDSLRVFSVHSDGFAKGSVRLMVEYTAVSTHSFVWWQRLKQANTPMQSSGERREVTRDGVKMFQGSNTFVLRNTGSIHFAIYSGTESVSVRLKMTAIQSPVAWAYTVPRRRNDFTNIMPSVPAPTSGDLNVSLSLDIDKSALASFETATVLTALNTSSDPPTAFETFPSAVADDISTSVKNTPDGVELFISLKYDVARYGGILTIRLSEAADDVYIQEFMQGRSIDIVHKNVNQVITNGIFGVYQFRPMTFFYEDMVGLICFAMGNPLPEIQILKESSPGTYVVVQSDTVIVEQWSRLNSLILTNRTTQTGNYTCRAKLGDQTIEVRTDVIAAEAIQFVASSTGVTENTTSRIMIRCTATGFPIPSLTFKLFDSYGPDMIISGRYPFVRNVTSNIASLTMTISPVDTGIVDVWCMALQSDADTTSGFEINIFPDGSQRNQTLYNELLNEQL